MLIRLIGSPGLQEVRHKNHWSVLLLYRVQILQSCVSITGQRIVRVVHDVTPHHAVIGRLHSVKLQNSIIRGIDRQNLINAVALTQMHDGRNAQVVGSDTCVVFLSDCVEQNIAVLPPACVTDLDGAAVLVARYRGLIQGRDEVVRFAPVSCAAFAALRKIDAGGGGSVVL